MYIIEDDFHAEPIIEKIETFEDAISELRDISKIPFGKEPNIPPCSNWENCQREYHIIEYDSQKPGEILSDIKVLLISSSGITWFCQSE
jgi:hypothetical protein